MKKERKDETKSTRRWTRTALGAAGRWSLVTMQLPLSLYCDKKKNNMYIFERLEEINIYLSKVWVKSHLSESNLSKKGPPKCAYSRHILFCDKSAMLFHKSMEKKNSDNPFLTLSCSYLFHSMKGLITVSRAFVFQNEGIQPFLSQINTFGKWLRLSAKSLLSKPEKTQISEQTQIIWVRWSLCPIILNISVADYIVDISAK